jgi:hypothetical protein
MQGRHCSRASNKLSATQKREKISSLVRVVNSVLPQFVLLIFQVTQSFLLRSRENK